MADIALWVFALVASLYCLAKSSEVFLEAVEAIGIRHGLSPFLIGVTLIAVGTSLPELVSSVFAVLAGKSEIAIGTAVGSNITNILLVLGTASLVGGGLSVAYELVRVDLPFLFGSALILTLFAFDGTFGRVEAFLSLAAATVYILYATLPKTPRTAVAVSAAAHLAQPSSTVGDWVRIAIGVILIQVGAYFTVESVIRISETVGIASEILATSVIAFGTSLPELTVSVQAARAGKPELAVGNVIGSNIFNALGVVGGAALFGPLIATPVIVGFALPAMVGTTILCFFVLQEREMTHWDGWLLLILYVGFTGELYGLF